MRAPVIVSSVAAALSRSRLRCPVHTDTFVSSLALTGTVGFPGSPTNFTFERGAAFRRAARLVPLPLPPVASARPPNAKHPSTLTICFPMDLMVVLSNGEKRVYPSCYRQRSMSLGRRGPLSTPPQTRVLRVLSRRTRITPSIALDGVMIASRRPAGTSARRAGVSGCGFGSKPSPPGAPARGCVQRWSQHSRSEPLGVEVEAGGGEEGGVGGGEEACEHDEEGC